MFALQYDFSLPADYDMQRVRDRIAAKGSVFDGFAGLIFKAFALTDRTQGARRNLYAPFYLWADAASAATFLRGPLFAAVSDAFGTAHISCGPAWAAPNLTTIVPMGLARRHVWDITQWPATDRETGGAAVLAWMDPSRATSTTFYLEDAAHQIDGELFETPYIARGDRWPTVA
jgi:hypothetical protein